MYICRYTHTFYMIYIYIYIYIIYVWHERFSAAKLPKARGSKGISGP